MKTTIDLPDDLYRRAKIKAVEQSTTLKDLLISSLAVSVSTSSQTQATTPAERWARRRIVPGYARLREANAFAAGTDSSTILDEERGAR